MSKGGRFWIVESTSHVVLRLTSMPKGEFVGIVVLPLMSTSSWCYWLYACVMSVGDG